MPTTMPEQRGRPAWIAQLESDALDRAAELLQRAAAEDQPVVLAGHVVPDGDALGSMLALHLGAAQIGLRTVPTWGEEPLLVPSAYADLPGVADLVPPSELPADPGALVALDTASADRLGALAPLVDKVPTIVIDHHVTNVGFGKIQLVAPGAAATVAVVEQLLERLDVQIDPAIATCLYVGLVTDTGRFQHANTDRAAMELAGRLLDAGVDHEQWTRRLFETRTLAELTVLGRVLGRLTVVPEVGLVHSRVEPGDLEETGIVADQLEGFIDILRSAEVADVALILKPAPDGTWRASIRSHGPVDVGAIAAGFGGGGHKHAAGFTVAEADPDRVVARIVDLLRSA